MGVFLLCGYSYHKEEKDVFKINEYVYIDRHTRNKFVFYARKEELADELAKRVTALGIFNLRRARIGFCKLYVTETPPYELELEQIEVIEGWEKIKMT